MSVQLPDKSAPASSHSGSATHRASTGREGSNDSPSTTTSDVIELGSAPVDSRASASIPVTGEDHSAMGIPEHGQLQRGLTPRTMAMVAIGGAIGTGLLVGTGPALVRGGPASILIAYCLVGAAVYVVMTGLCECLAWLPSSEHFSGLASRVVDPSMGFALGWIFYCKYLVGTPSQITAGVLVIQLWVPRETVNPGVWTALILIVIVTVNSFGIYYFGELEFWLSSFKVIVILGVMILSIVIASGGGPDHTARGFYYWSNPGAFAPISGVSNPSTARLVAFWGCITYAAFAYIGTELVAVTVGEARNPRKSVPRAVRLTFFRISFFYCASVLLLGMVVPYNSRELSFAVKQDPGASASPFVVAIRLAGIRGLDNVLNGCILVFVLSASTSDLYVASRTLYGLAQQRRAPAFFTYTNRFGVPIAALGLTAAFACLAFTNVTHSSQVIFGYLVSLVTVFGLLTWCCLLILHIRFVRARRVQCIHDAELVYVAPLGSLGSVGALMFLLLVILFKGIDAFVPTFNAVTFVVSYLGVALFVVLFVGHKIIRRTSFIRARYADLHTGKQTIDDYEAQALAAEQTERLGGRYKPAHSVQAGLQGFYRVFLSWLF